MKLLSVRPQVAILALALVAALTGSLTASSRNAAAQTSATVTLETEVFVFRDTFLGSNPGITTGTPFERATLSVQSPTPAAALDVDASSFALNGVVFSDDLPPAIRFKLATTDGDVLGLLLQNGSDAIFLPELNQVTPSLTLAPGSDGGSPLSRVARNQRSTVLYGLFPVGSTVRTGQVVAQSNFGGLGDARLFDVVSYDADNLPAGGVIVEDTRAVTGNSAGVFLTDPVGVRVDVRFSDGTTRRNVPAMARLTRGVYGVANATYAIDVAALGRPISTVDTILDRSLDSSVNLNYDQLGFDVETTPFVAPRLFGPNPPDTLRDDYVARSGVTLNVSAADGLLANDTDLDPGTTLTVSLRPNFAPRNGTLTVNPNGSFSFRANQRFVGLETMSVEVSDGRNSTYSTLGIIVQRSSDAGNRAPVGVDDSFDAGQAEVVEPRGITFYLAANDTDPDGDALTTELVSSSSGLSSVVVNPNGTFRATRAPGFVGTASFDYRVSDGFATDTATVTINFPFPARVIPRNADPVANIDFYDVPNGSINVNAASGVLANDTDSDGPRSELEAQILFQPENGSATLNSDGSFSYTANPGFTGIDSFVYRTRDALDFPEPDAEETDVASVVLTVGGVNPPPTTQPPTTQPPTTQPPTTQPPTTQPPTTQPPTTQPPTTQPPTTQPPTTQPPTTQPPGGPSALLISLLANGFGFADEDVIEVDPTTGQASMLFDGSDVGLRRADVDAVARLSDGDLLLSFNRALTVAGLQVDDSDVVRFSPTSTGNNTAGSFSMFLDGSDLGLTTNGEDIDAIEILSETGPVEIAISTIGTARVPGANFRDEDLARLTLTQTGANSQGSWSRFFDGSDVGLSSRDEDVYGATLDDDGDLILTTRGSFSVPGASGSGVDLATCGDFVSGSSTGCSFRVDFTGASAGLTSGSIDALSLG